MTSQERYIVNSDEDGSRLDRLLHRRNDLLPWHRIQHLLRRSKVRVDGVEGSGAMRVRCGQVVTVAAAIDNARHVPASLMEKEKARELLQGMVIHEDERLLVLNKPQGIAVQGGSGLGQHHLDYLLRSLYGGDARLVHRLDKKVSGLLLVALQRDYARELASLFKHRALFKVYWGITSAPPPHEMGEMNQPLQYKSKSLAACTRYRHLAKLPRERHLLAFYPLTGRKHQIRIHAGMEGMALLGDGYYGGARHGSLQLHGRMMAWRDAGGDFHRFVAPVPPVMASLLHDVAVTPHELAPWEMAHYDWLNGQGK